MKDVLDTPILQLSETDVLDTRAACEGIFALGSPGAGKTTGIGDNTMFAALRAGYGAVFLREGR